MADKLPEEKAWGRFVAKNEELSGHEWRPPHGAVKWEHCGKCGLVRRRDGFAVPCKGPRKVTLRKELTDD